MSENILHYYSRQCINNEGMRVDFNYNDLILSKRQIYFKSMTYVYSRNSQQFVHSQHAYAFFLISTPDHRVDLLLVFENSVFALFDS